MISGKELRLAYSPAGAFRANIDEVTRRSRQTFCSVRLCHLWQAQMMRNTRKSVTQLGRPIAHAKSKRLCLPGSTESESSVQSIMHIHRQSLTDTLVNMNLQFNEDSSNDKMN